MVADSPIPPVSQKSGTTARYVQGDKYASQRFNSQSVQTFPPPPSPSSLQAWQLAVPVPLAVSHQASTKSAKVPPASYPTSETWEIFVHLDEVREGGGGQEGEKPKFNMDTLTSFYNSSDKQLPVANKEDKPTTLSSRGTLTRRS